MKTILFPFAINDRFVNFSLKLKIFHIIIILFFFQFSFLHGQNSEVQKKNEPATVVLVDGARLFSADDAFNNQVASQKIVLKNAEVKSGNSTGKTLVVTSLKNELPDKNVKRNLKKMRDKSEEFNSKKLEKKLADTTIISKKVIQ